MNHNKDWTWANLVRFLVKVLNKRNLLLRTCAPGGLWQERNIGDSNHTKLLPGSFMWGSQETQALQDASAPSDRQNMEAGHGSLEVRLRPEWLSKMGWSSGKWSIFSIGKMDPLGVGWNHWRWNKLEKFKTILWYDHPNLPICLGVDHPGRACCSTCQSSASCTTGEATCKWASEGWEKR